MNMLSLIGNALSALRENKLRSGLTLLGVIIGISSVVGLVGLGNSIQGSIETDISGFGADLITIFPANFTGQVFSPETGTTRLVNQITLDDVEALNSWDQGGSYKGVTTTKAAGGVAWIVGRQAMVQSQAQFAAVSGLPAGGGFQSGQDQFFVADNISSFNVEITGVLPNFIEVQNHSISAGSFINAQHVENGTRTVVLGDGTAIDLFGTRDALGAEIALDGKMFTVIGVLDLQQTFFGSGSSVFIPMSTYLTEFGSEADYTPEGRITASVLTISAKDRASIGAAATAVLTWLSIQYGPNAADDFMVFTAEDILETIESAIGTLQIFLGAVAAISLFVGGIGVMNTMLVTVTERTREIGLRRALGARRPHILSQFMIESVIITLIGGIVGVAAGFGVGTVFIAFFNQAPQGMDGCSGSASVHAECRFSVHCPRSICFGRPVLWNLSGFSGFKATTNRGIAQRLSEHVGKQIQPYSLFGNSSGGYVSDHT